jgi:hypothetical protein
VPVAQEFSGASPIGLSACLRAALLDWGVVMRLPTVAGRSDVAVFERLSHLLARPAGVVCRDMAVRLEASAAWARAG